MPATVFKDLKSLLKAHPEMRPVARPDHDTVKSREATDSLTRPPALDRHRRKCTICRHPNRLEIEHDFLRWRSAAEIAKDFGIADHSSICRHARATGLREQRQRTIAYALHPLLEQAEDVFIKTTPSAIINAVRTYSQINDEGRRLRSKPVTKVYYVNEPAVDVSRHSPLATRHRVSGFDPSRHSPALSGVEGSPATRHRVSGVDVSRHSPLATRHRLSNRPIQELEDDSTH